MFSRKITFRTDQNKLEELIHALDSEYYSPEGPEAELLAESETLSFYFQNLHQHISPQNLVLVKRYENLHDGLYVLLKGQISLVYQGGNIQNQKDGHKMKNSGFKSMPGSCLIAQPFSVFDCSLKNCTTTEDSYLLKIKEEQSLNAKFYEYYNQRKQLYDNHYLDSSHQQLLKTQEANGIFTVDMKIHSNFVFKHYSFRQVINLNSIAVVACGKVKLREKAGNGHDLERFAVLLPCFEYEVTSSTVQVMYIINNESLNVKINMDVQKDSHQKKLPGILKESQTLNRKPTRKVNSNLETMFSGLERDKREKQVIKLSKESENYSIISSFLCQKSLNFVKNQSLSTKQREKKEERCRNPLVLFNIVNEKSKLSTPNFTNVNTPLTNKRSVHFKSEKKFEIDQPASPNKNILRKLRLPLKDYEQMVKRQTTAGVRCAAKAKSLFTLTAGPNLASSQDNQGDQFVRYNE